MLEEELEFLYSLMREGIKLDLGIMNSFSEMLGHPERDFRSFHVAGTNGKGSTAAFIYNIARQKKKSGLYTSPHLVKFNERIILERDQITDSYIADFVGKHRGTITELARENRNPTFFETTTMMAFKHFSELKAEYASIEVGLGGRLDSTNIVTPDVSVITQIGYDHADKLGCSLTSIANEKGGIIKEGVPVILSDSKPEVVKTIRSISSLRNSRLVRTDMDAKISGLQVSEEGTEFSLTTSMDEYSIRSSLIGEFQARNIAAAVLALENSSLASVSRGDIEKGILETRWPGRMEILRASPKVFLDSSHNPPAASSLTKTFKKVTNRKPLLVVGMLSDKDSYSYLSVMRGLSDSIVFTAPREEKRAWDSVKAERLYGEMFKTSKVIPDPIEAYEYALSKSDLILVTGSMYLVGLIKEHEGGAVMPYLVN